jgi:hypothetical protein
MKTIEHVNFLFLENSFKIIDNEEELAMVVENDSESFSSARTSLDELVEFNESNFEFISERDFSLDSSFKNLKISNTCQFDFEFELSSRMNTSHQLVFEDDLAIIEDLGYQYRLRWLIK